MRRRRSGRAARAAHRNRSRGPGRCESSCRSGGSREGRPGRRSETAAHRFPVPRRVPIGRRQVRSCSTSIAGVFWIWPTPAVGVCPGRSGCESRSAACSAPAPGPTTPRLRVRTLLESSVSLISEKLPSSTSGIWAIVRIWDDQLGVGRGVDLLRQIEGDTLLAVCPKACVRGWPGSRGRCRSGRSSPTADH